ncbi:hypothetical protein JTB14_003994 [Gonioctena quinquepunctata]|nr:hypothetical protein JTB14_003994 [Gonioctena quinquepunctata]
MINKQCAYPRGKVLGGSAGINFIVYSRGSYADFDNWEKLGNESWSYDNVSPHFKKSEHADKQNFDRDYHGTKGPLHVNSTAQPTIIAEAIEKACAAKGLNKSYYNGQTQLGIARTQFNININKRASGSQAILDPIKDHSKNLNITLNPFVIKILIKGNRAYGVEFIGIKRDT